MQRPPVLCSHILRMFSRQEAGQRNWLEGVRECFYREDHKEVEIGRLERRCHVGEHRGIKSIPEERRWICREPGMHIVRLSLEHAEGRRMDEALPHSGYRI